jgi:4-amino-4-deoxy-L-arabinose transferase-like glycosyltransferase
MLRAVCAFVAVTLLAVPLLVDAPLLDPDEGLHAAIAQEMVLRHDYVTPTFLGEPFLDKPILFFWAEAWSLRLFGMNESAVRLPPLLFGTLGMLSVALLGAALFGTRAGLVGGIVYATMVLPVAISNVAVHDIALVPFVCGTAWSLWRAAHSARAWAWGIPAGLCLGLSILTKGLAGAVFAGIFTVCLAAVRPAAILRLAIALTSAGIVALLVAAPWNVAMERAHPGYLYYYFVERHLRGYLTATQRHAGRPFWYYVPIVAGGALPWTGYLPAAVRSIWRADATAAPPVSGPLPLRATLLIVWSWFAIGFVFVSVGESKLVTYVLPAFPALALGIAALLLSGPRSRAGFVTAVAALAVLPMAAVFAVHRLLQTPVTTMWIVPAVAAVTVLAIARVAWRLTSSDAFVGASAAMALVSLAAVLIAPFPRAADFLTARDLAHTLNERGALPPRVSILDERIGSIVFYLSPALREEATPARIQTTSLSVAIERARVDPDDAVLAIRDDELRRFLRLFPRPPQPSARSGTFTVFRADRLREALRTRE